MFLGSLQKGSLEVMGAVVELGGGGRPGLEWVLRIQVPNMCTVFEVAVPSRDQALEWMSAIKETAQNASVRVGECIPVNLFSNKHRTKSFKSVLSDLV